VHVHETTAPFGLRKRTASTSPGRRRDVVTLIASRCPALLDKVAVDVLR
jgi:hypothetical protein